ncbi:MAG: hypothetical protein R3F61_14310 [Myxococcota bacterium]
MHPDEVAKQLACSRGTANPSGPHPLWEHMAIEGLHPDDIASRHALHSRPKPSWSPFRYGQSTTVLADGTEVLVGGHQDDAYSDEFFIYNDVIVHSPDGSVRIHTYATDAFPPTDLHSATEVDGRLLLVGNLGYPEHRGSRVQVVSIDLTTFRAEQIPTEGDAPGWLHGHDTVPSGLSALEIRGGRVLVGDTLLRNPHQYSLDANTLQWRRVGSVQLTELRIGAADGSPLPLWRIRGDGDVSDRLSEALYGSDAALDWNPKEFARETFIAGFGGPVKCYEGLDGIEVVCTGPVPAGLQDRVERMRQALEAATGMSLVVELLPGLE